LPVAAVSAGVVGGQPVLDLEYSEDASADVDANFVMRCDGHWIEAQATAEGAPFRPELFAAMAELATEGIRQLLTLWEQEGWRG
jgi:ribonuclease PH